MSDTHIENAIIESVEIIADEKLSQASFDKTIKAVVKKIKDKFYKNLSFYIVITTCSD